MNGHGRHCLDKTEGHVCTGNLFRRRSKPSPRGTPASPARPGLPADADRCHGDAVQEPQRRHAVTSRTSAPLPANPKAFRMGREVRGGRGSVFKDDSSPCRSQRLIARAWVLPAGDGAVMNSSGSWTLPSAGAWIGYRALLASPMGGFSQLLSSQVLPAQPSATVIADVNYRPTKQVWLPVRGW